MKKLISVLLAVSALALSTSAFAADSISSTYGRNNKAFATTATESLPCFRNGDTVNFTLSGVTGTVTLISYADGSTIDDSTIQYINQYAKDTDGNVSVTYKVRDRKNGKHTLLIKDGENTVVTYYYNVANPTANVLTDKDGNYVLADNGKGTIAFGAVASSNGASFTDSGAKATFTLTDADGNSAFREYGADVLDGYLGQEVNGNADVFYAIEVTGVTEGVVITPSVKMD